MPKVKRQLMCRQKLSSQAPWEDLVGYSRAIKVGPHIFVSGTTGLGADGKIVGINHPYAQAFQALQNISQALLDLGGQLKDVVRTRIYVKDIQDWDKIAKAHHDFFKDIKPACTLVEINRFIQEDILVEIEADALIYP